MTMNIGVMLLVNSFVVLEMQKQNWSESDRESIMKSTTCHVPFGTITGMAPISRKNAPRKASSKLRAKRGFVSCRNNFCTGRRMQPASTCLLSKSKLSSIRGASSRQRAETGESRTADILSTGVSRVRAPLAHGSLF